MKKTLKIIVLAALVAGISVNAQARNVANNVPIDAALHSKDADTKVDPSIKLYFADQAHPKVLETYGSGVANEKTNMFDKTDLSACNWVFLSSIISLQTQARERGANAVINIVSYYKKNTMSSSTLFECHNGFYATGVALKGDFVKVK